MIHAERIQPINRRSHRKGQYVLYWMQASQRAEFNHALEYAIERANELQLPLITIFAITDHYPEANERHYAFMLEGLAETQTALAKRGIQLVVRHQDPKTAVVDLADRAALLVTDRGYTRIQKTWRRTIAGKVPCPMVQIESDVVVPAEVTSNKAEYAAATIRPKIHRHWTRFLAPLAKRRLKRDSLDMKVGGISLEDIPAVLADLRIDHSIKPVTTFRGGTSQAKRLLRGFIKHKLADYADKRNDPSLDIQSHQSPYLHFGQISPVDIALRIQAADAPVEAVDSYMEQLIVRRELMVNFVNFNREYASYHAIPAWARATLRTHRHDRRPIVYRLRDLENAATHDEYWNAAMREMLLTGKMHNYMRMYWGKKIMEWTRSPRWAHRVTLLLNNRYFLDGRDPSSYGSVSWCFGLHDRPWGERPIFGKTRYMNAAGLKRKFDMAGYLARIDRLG